MFCVHIGPSGDEELDHFRPSRQCRHMQGRSETATGLNVCAGIKENPHNLGMAKQGTFVDRVLAIP